MKLRQAAAAVAAGIMTFATAAAVYAEAPQAAPQAADYDVLSLPVQILDFNKDNLIFEYTLKNGTENWLDFVDFTKEKLDIAAGEPGEDGKPTEVAYADGLVETPLVGTLTYKPEEITRIAGLLGKALAADDQPADQNPVLYKKLQEKILLPGNKIETANDGTLGDTSNNDVLKNWAVSVDGQAVPYAWGEGSAYQVPQNRQDRPPVAWYYLYGDNLHLADSTVSLQRTFTVAEDNDVRIAWRNKAGSIKVSAHYGDEEVEDIAKDQVLHTPEGVTEITLTISCTSDATKDADNVLEGLYFAETGVPEVNVLSNENGENAEQRQWTSTDKLGNTVSTSVMDNNYRGSIGSVLWHRDNDGIICDVASSISQDFTVNPSSLLTVDYWNTSSPTISVYDTNNTELGSYTATDAQAAPRSATFQIPDDVYQIKLVVSGQPGDRVAAMKVSSSRGVRLGDLGTARTFADQNAMLTAENLTATEYVKYMLTHLFTPTTGLNTEDTRYNELVLRKQEDGSYEFDSDKAVCYDEAHGMLYNDVSGENRGGFFPEDNIAGGETMNNEQNEPRNYHFTLRSGGTFVYRKAKNLYFDFSGDDDVYLFINNRLALDLGGAHKKASKRIELNAMADQLGLEDGKTYNFDFFYMERHTTGSNLRINTNIDVQRRVDDAAKVTQNIQFKLDGLDTLPEELFVQPYQDGKLYGGPLKFTPGDPDAFWRQLQFAQGYTYTFALLRQDTASYEVVESGETLVAADPNGAVKTLIYTLRRKPSQPTAKPDNGSSNGGTTTVTTPAATAAPQATATPAPAAKTAAVAGTIPQTADTSHPVLLGILCVVGAFGFGLLAARKYMRR